MSLSKKDGCWHCHRYQENMIDSLGTMDARMGPGIFVNTLKIIPKYHVTDHLSLAKMLSVAVIANRTELKNIPFKALRCSLSRPRGGEVEHIHAFMIAGSDNDNRRLVDKLLRGDKDYEELIDKKLIKLPGYNKKTSTAYTSKELSDLALRENRYIWTSGDMGRYTANNVWVETTDKRYLQHLTDDPERLNNYILSQVEIMSEKKRTHRDFPLFYIFIYFNTVDNLPMKMLTVISASDSVFEPGAAVLKDRNRSIRNTGRRVSRQLRGPPTTARIAARRGLAASLKPKATKQLDWTKFR